MAGGDGSSEEFVEDDSGGEREEEEEEDGDSSASFESEEDDEVRQRLRLSAAFLTTEFRPSDHFEFLKSERTNPFTTSSSSLCNVLLSPSLHGWVLSAILSINACLPCPS